MSESSGDIGEAEEEKVPEESSKELHKLNQFRVYKRRWFVLGTVCLLSCSNAMIWIGFAPVANLTASYFNLSLDTVNLFSLVYVIITIPFGFGASWLLDTLGLKSAIILCSWLNMTGSLIRCLSIISFLSNSHIAPIYIFVGQCICAVAQPLVLFVPAKLAAVWFPDHQRATANMIASMSNPLGVLIANMLSPAIVRVDSDLPHLIGLYSIPAVVACTLATAGIWSKAPPTPPSASALSSTSESFFSGIKLCAWLYASFLWVCKAGFYFSVYNFLLKNKAYLILMVCFGAGVGIFTAFAYIFGTDPMLQWLFKRLCGALFILFGIIGGLVCGLYVDKTKQFTEVVKICFCLASLMSIAFALASNFRDQAVLLAVVCSLFGFFGFSIYAISMELAVECSYPVGEGSSTGLAFISGQVLSLIFMVLLQATTKSYANSPLSSCGTSQTEIYNWSTSTLILAGLSTFASSAFVLLFHTDYKRLRAEANPPIREERIPDIYAGT